ncbi:MAG: ATP-binding cassette domain-containing protein [Pseudomonadota bacterium]
MIALNEVKLARPSFRLSLSYSVSAGSRVVILGRSGAGKSTLLDLIAGFLRPDAGQIVIDGKDVTDWPVAARPVSVLFQDGNLFPHLSAFENVALGLRPDLRLTEADRHAVDARLAEVGLAGFAARRPGALSGGQQARVALARMLLRERPVALMDEPFAALDPGLRHEMAALVADLAQRTRLTLVMVAHDLRGLDVLMTDVLVLEDGQIAASQRAGDLHDTPAEALRDWL